MDKLIDQLQRDGVITEDQARVVKIESKLKRISARHVLLQSEFASAETLESYRAGEVRLILTAEDFIPDVNAIAQLPEAAARCFNALPIKIDTETQTLSVAIDDTTNVLVRDRLRRSVAAHISLEFLYAGASVIKQTLDKCYGGGHLLREMLTELDQLAHLSLDFNEHEQTPITRLVDALLQDAFTRRASDIHLSPEDTYVQIKYRIDGVLQLISCLHIRFWSALLVRIKVMSDIDIAETRAAQDGHLVLNIHGQAIDFRVSSFPLRSGENLVLRVLDRRRNLLPLSALCSDQNIEQSLRQMMHRPSGLVLVCGPTGSGKTTTLYALLRSLDAHALNIMTLEDPVEYSMQNIRQTSINKNAAFGFAEGVRGVLRQDPDVILVGEVRDADSCAMTCRAAMTGHLVLTSTHAADCVSAIARLIELGANRATLASILSGVVSQRLVRKLCQHCQTKDTDCSVCANARYSGRVAVFEHLNLSAEFSEQLYNGASYAELHNQAWLDGMVPLAETARGHVQRGRTTTEELQRVFGNSAVESFV